MSFHGTFVPTIRQIQFWGFSWQTNRLEESYAQYIAFPFQKVIISVILTARKVQKEILLLLIPNLNILLPFFFWFSASTQCYICQVIVINQILKFFFLKLNIIQQILLTVNVVSCFNEQAFLLEYQIHREEYCSNFHKASIYVTDLQVKNQDMP